MFAVLSMSANPSQIVIDAKILATRLQERDKMTDSLIRHAQAVTEKINCLKEYKEDLNDLHELRIAQRPRSVLVHNLQQENRQIKILQDENRQLKLALEEHQATLDIIMQRYRQQVVEMIKLNKLQQMADNAIDGVHKNNFIDESNKLVEFARLFDQCLKNGEESSTKDQEELTRLKTENQTLRQLLKIASQNDPNFFLIKLNEAKNQQASTSIESKNDNEPSTPTNEIAPIVPQVDVKPKIEPAPKSVDADANIVAVSTASASKTTTSDGPVASAVCSKIVKASTTPSIAPGKLSSTLTVNGNNNNNTQPATSAATTPSTATNVKSTRPSSTAATKRVSLPHVQPSMTTAVKKSTSQDSAIFNGVTPSTTKSSSTTTTTPSKTAAMVKKKSSSDIKVGNAAGVIVANAKPTTKSSTPVVNKNTTATTKGGSVR